jgi:aminoglycoside phosphotransferase (APT) family kinase protein
MDSKTKVQLAPGMIEKLFGRALGGKKSVTIRELTDGWFNTAYYINAEDGGQQVVLKVGPPETAPILTYEKNIMRAEVESMNLAAADPSIPVPRILYADFSRGALPYDFYFMEYIAGTTWDKLRDKLGAAQNQDIERQLGQITARINSFTGQAFGYYAYGRAFDNWTEAFGWMCRMLFADAQRFQIALELDEEEFFAYFEQHQAIFSEVTVPHLVHWDLWAGNIFIRLKDEKASIAGILDFERALWGDPVMEAHLRRMRDLEQYHEGYGQDLLATKAQRLRRIFYNIYLDLIMIIEDGPRQYDDKSSVIWATERLRRDIKMLRHGDCLSGDLQP